MAEEYRSYKTELDPNNVQRTTLYQFAVTARFIWNWGLAKRIEEYKQTGKSSNAFSLGVKVTELKKTDFPWLASVSAVVPEMALRNLDRAFDAFFKKRARFPRFKSRKRGVGGFGVKGCFTVEDRRIRIPKIGWLRLKEAGYLPVGAKVASAVVSERAGRWFISVDVKETVDVPAHDGPAVGIDLGLKCFSMCSDGKEIHSPRPIRRSCKRLVRLSRQHSNKKKGSVNRKKSAKRLARLHYRIACQRNDFLHKATTALTKTNSVIVVENLNVAGLLRNSKLAKHISDASWSEFVRQLEYKAARRGGRVVRADRFMPSTKTCSACGIIKDEMPLSVRIFECDGCGHVMDRDLNAAKNLLALHSARPARIQACGDLPSGESLKQEPNIALGESVSGVGS